MTMVLQDQDSALDLMLRGYSRDEVRRRTGIDIGYNGRALRSQASGIDRAVYKLAHVRRRVDVAQRRAALDLVRQGRPKVEVLDALGLAGPDLVSLKTVFAGVDLADDFVEARKQGRQTVLQSGMQAAHGVTNGFQMGEVQAKAASVREQRYGAAFTLARGSVLADQAQKRAQQSRGLRRPAPVVDDDLVGLGDRLVEQFGVDDVVRDYRDDVRYPFRCAFYVSSQDLFIEMLDRGSLFDQPDRHQAAERAGLNIVVMRRSMRGMDVDLWFALGCPDGKDWDHDYSWIGPRVRRDIDPHIVWPADLTGSVGISRRAARAANAETFYAREVALWRRNPSGRRGSIRGRLLCNRHHYLHKLPDQLTDLELVRGMRISGLVRGYTAFDNSGMVTLLDRYTVKSVYDPCAGWGERLATCAGHHVRYLGVDVNEPVVRGHQRIVHRYGLSEQTTMVADGARFDARGRDHEMVFTCPPYGDLEVYTAQGAETLPWDEFLSWWGRVVDMSVGRDTKVFAYQINQDCRDDMNAVLESKGWLLVDQIDVGRHAVAHFNRDADGRVLRSEFEQVQVFEMR